MTICFTGKLENFTRASAQKAAREKGLEVWTSVKKGLDILVAADPDSGSSKMVKATSFGIKIISEEDFMRLIDFSSPSQLQGKRTIYDVLKDEGDDVSTKDELISTIDDVLSSCFYDDHPECNNDKFRIDLANHLLSGNVIFDDSWDNGEVYMMIENEAYDLAGTSLAVKQILGTNSNGQLCRVCGL